jgi:hypothetical protein
MIPRQKMVGAREMNAALNPQRLEESGIATTIAPVTPKTARSAVAAVQFHLSESDQNRRRIYGSAIAMPSSRMKTQNEVLMLHLFGVLQGIEPVHLYPETATE